MRLFPVKWLSLALGGLALASLPAGAADHVDLPRSVGVNLARPDASITDFFTFVAGRNLVMILDLNPGLSPDVRTYRFPTDVTYRFNIDVDASVSVGRDVVSREFGGVIARPERISEDIVFEVTFDAQNQPRLEVTGADADRCRRARRGVRIFAGLRAEAFIFAPFVRNNIAGIAIEVPLEDVVERREELLLWAPATVDTPAGLFVEHGGRALRSQFEPFVDLNTLHPSQHVASGFSPPDVVILDTGRPSRFPNGRALDDDVVTIVADFDSLPTDGIAAQNEVNFCLPGGRFFPCPVEASATSRDSSTLRRFPWLGEPYTSAGRPGRPRR